MVNIGFYSSANTMLLLRHNLKRSIEIDQNCTRELIFWLEQLIIHMQPS